MSGALAAPRDPHKPGPWGKQKRGPNRTLTLTDAGRETVLAYRAARLEAERGVTVYGWVDVLATWLDDAEAQA